MIVMFKKKNDIYLCFVLLDIFHKLFNTLIIIINNIILPFGSNLSF